ncbi:MAG: hypothetical protein AMXMBFR77_28020 [Phycisphaerales bacterium]
MSALDVIQGQSAAAEHWLDRAPATAAATIYSPSGTPLASPTVAVDTIGVVVSGFVSPQTVTVTERSGVVNGERYLLRRSERMQAPIRVESGAGAAGAGDLLLSSPTHFAPAAGDSIHGLRLSCTIPPAATGARGTNYRVEWFGLDIDGRAYRQQTIFHVVRIAYGGLVTPTAVLEFVASAEGSKAKRMLDTPQRIADIAARANDLVRLHIQATGRYQHLSGDISAFEEAGRAALRYVLLAQDGLANDRDGGQAATRKELLTELVAAVELGIQGMGFYDQDDSGGIEGPEETAPFALRWVR